MKKTHLLYGIVLLAIVAFIAGVLTDATQTHPTQGNAQQAQGETTTPPEPTTPTVTKKSCSCCDARAGRLKEQIRKARERRMAAQQASTTVAEPQTP